MFESAEIGHKVSKAQYKEQVPVLREAFLEAQATLFAEKKLPVVVLISGEDGAGKRETISVLYEWMDPRYLSTLAFEAPTDEEQERPAMWRYWRALPPKGRIGIFSGSWYSDPIRMRISGELSEMELDARAAQINRFETMLVNEGALVLKFWFHLSKEGQKVRLKKLENWVTEDATMTVKHVGVFPALGNACGALCEWINRDREIIPWNTIRKPPSAELRPNQTDQDSLPPYEVLDRILKAYIVEEKGAAEIVASGEDPAVVHRILKLTASAEYKRWQAPPVLKVSRVSFGIGRRHPLVRTLFEL